MANLASQPIERAGLTPAYAAAGGAGDKFHPSASTFLHVKNGGGATRTVTVVTPGQVSGQGIADLAVDVPAGAERMIGPFPSRLFGDPEDAGMAAISYSSNAGLTLGAFEMGEL